MFHAKNEAHKKYSLVDAKLDYIFILDLQKDMCKKVPNFFPKPTSTPYSPPPERKNGSTGPRTEGFQTVFLAHWYLLTLDICGHQKPLFWVLFWHHWDAVERQMGIPNLSVTQLGPLVCTWSRTGAPRTKFGRKL